MFTIMFDALWWIVSSASVPATVSWTWVCISQSTVSLYEDQSWWEFINVCRSLLFNWQLVVSSQHIAHDAVVCCLWIPDNLWENFNPLSGKAVYKAKAILNTYVLFIYGNTHYITNSFCAKNSYTLSYFVNCIFNNFFLLFSALFLFHMMCRKINK